MICEKDTGQCTRHIAATWALFVCTEARREMSEIPASPKYR